MSYLFNVTGVVGVLRTFITSTLIANGESSVNAIPTTFSAMQFPFDKMAMPFTMLEMGAVQVAERTANSNRLQLSVIVHHFRLRDGTDNEEDVATTLMSALASAMEADYRLAAAGGAAIPIQSCLVTTIAMGGSNRLQMLIDASDNNMSLAVVSVPLSIVWNEGL